MIPDSNQYLTPSKIEILDKEIDTEHNCCHYEYDQKNNAKIGTLFSSIGSHHKGSDLLLNAMNYKDKKNQEWN